MSIPKKHIRAASKSLEVGSKLYMSTRKNSEEDLKLEAIVLNRIYGRHNTGVCILYFVDNKAICRYNLRTLLGLIANNSYLVGEKIGPKALKTIRTLYGKTY